MRSSVDIRRMIFGVVVVCAFGTAVFGQPWAGSGTAEDPYQIWDACDMQAIGADSNYWNANFILCVDINISEYTGTAFNIIGNSLTKFTGVFDGNGHTISNFTYTCTDIDNIGLFGYVNGHEAKIKDVRLLDPNINGGTGSFIGALAGSLETCLMAECCVVGGSVTGDDYCVGGLVGLNDGIIVKCHSSGNVVGQRSVGGLVGVNTELISNCYSNSSVSGTDAMIGGLVGWNVSQGVIKECSSTGIVSGSQDVGGLVGKNNWAYIYGCYSIANTFGGNNTGGLVGMNTDGRGVINDSYSKGNVEGNESVGGLVGKNYYGDVASVL